MTSAPAGRDVDRQRVYDAEEAAFGGTTMTERLTWPEVTSLASAVAADPWWVALDVPAPAIEHARADASTSSADGTRIRLCAAGQDAATIVHELAHHLDVHLSWRGTARGPRSALDAPHGPRFRATALRTAMVVGGWLAVEQLATAWDQTGLTVAGWAWAEPERRQGRALGGVIALGPSQ
jgi:hypothetical protein